MPVRYVIQVIGRRDVLMAVEVRLMRESDIDQTWPLMRDLAIFEDYIDSFAITPEIVRERGIKKIRRISTV